MMELKIHVLLLLCASVSTLGIPSNYDVHWLEQATTFMQNTPSTKKSADIFCYPGTSKSIITLWQTVKFNIKIKDDQFSQYIGSSPEQVYNDYIEDSQSWSVVNPFQNRVHKSVSLELFNTTCMALNTKQPYSIELQILRVDLWRILLMLSGIVLIFASRVLSGNPVFFYLCGILIGVFASFMVLVYYISKLLPKRTMTYGILIGGWTVGVYIFQQVWENIRSIVFSYQTHLFWYTLVVGFISFLVCYRIGPPKNRRSQNLVMWTLQSLGVLCIFFSSNYQEASAAIIVMSLLAKYFPDSLLYNIQSHWRRRFPPKPRLLTNEEYYEQGARETKNALDELRKHCSSPDCAQWRIMLKLNDSKRFASFVEGDSHLSDDEILGYESYAFNLERGRKVHHTPSNSTANDLELTDDDDSSSD